MIESDEDGLWVVACKTVYPVKSRDYPRLSDLHDQTICFMAPAI